MTKGIQQVTKDEIKELISSGKCGRLNNNEKQLYYRCLSATSRVWVGFIDGEPVCIWGIVPPTLISTQAYLWLHVNETLKGHEFIFIRHSQRAIEVILREYPEIVGHATPGADKSIRWLRWLGAEFGEPEGTLIPFTIRRGNND